MIPMLPEQAAFGWRLPCCLLGCPDQKPQLWTQLPLAAAKPSSAAIAVRPEPWSLPEDAPIQAAEKSA